MGRPRRPRLEAPLNVDLPIPLIQAVDEFCERHRFKKKYLLELALWNFLHTHQAVKK